MNKRYNPERGYFIGKVSNYLIAGVLSVFIFYPTIIKADTVLPDDSMVANNASSIIATAAMHALNGFSMPTIRESLVWITAYASVPGETDDTPFITASGDYVRDGIVASNFLPFGTKIRIPTLFGSKIFTVEDRMNVKFNQRVDIWMPTVNAAIYFGLQHAPIEVLDS
jgi:3D (Asp-Asp-Asp) domain-containing protein